MINSDDTSKKKIILDRMSEVLYLWTRKVFSAKEEVRQLERRINLRKARRIDYPYSILLFDGIEKTHLEMFNMLKILKDDTRIRVKSIQMETRHLKSLIDKKNEEAGHIEERLNLLLDKVHKSSFSSPGDKEHVVSFLYRYYDVENIKRRIEKNEKLIPDFFLIDQG